MAAQVGAINLLEQWDQVRQQLAAARLQLLEEQNQHAQTREKLVDSEEYRTYAATHIADLDEAIRLIQDRLDQERQARELLQGQLQQRQDAIRQLEDQVLLRDHHVGDAQAQVQMRDRLIEGLRQEIEAIIRLKNRAIRIRDLVIAILTLSLEIERENTVKAATVSTTLTAGFFISPPWAIAAGLATALFGAIKGDLHNAKQSHLQLQVNRLQEELDQVKRAR